jgi:hypothetical protein
MSQISLMVGAKISAISEISGQFFFVQGLLDPGYN